MMIRRTFLAAFGAFALAANAWLPVSGPAAAADQAPEKIRMGYAVSLSGPYAPGAGTTTIGNYKLWLHDVNAAGGIYLKKYDKKVPVEFIEYDDQSQLEESVKAYERLILNDKVDFLLPPWGTATHMAVGPLFEKHKYPMIAETVSADKINELAKKWKYAFWMLPPPQILVGSIVDAMDGLRKDGKLGNKVAVAYIADQLGVEMNNVAAKVLKERGYDVVYDKSYPLGVSDLSQQVKEMKRLEPETFLSFSYPLDSMMFTEQSMVLDFNPKFVYVAVGPPHPYFLAKFGGPMNINGMTGLGGLDPSLPSIQDYIKRYRDVIKQEPDLTGGPPVYASLQMLQEAIEAVGDIKDRAKIAEYIDKTTFETVAGPLHFEGHILANYWVVGQWQNGQWVGIEPKGRHGAQPVLFPKPKWTPPAQ
jgi:branched-chain amino acid transport system substrate-binding protein